MSSATMVKLRDLGQWTGGNTPSKANRAYWTDGTIPWVSPKDMKVDEITSSQDRITETALTDGRVSLVPEGSVLFVTRSGILAHTLPVAVTKVPVTINQDLKALRPHADVLPHYVALAVRGSSHRILKDCSKHGTTVASIDTSALLDFEIPLVGIQEQHRIVADIETQFSRLDEAVGNLNRIKANLKRYQSAVLNAAVGGRLVPNEGELTRQRGSALELDRDRLQHMLDARASASRGNGKHKEPLATDAKRLPPLPEGWVWTRLDAIASIKGGITVDKKRRDPRARPVPYLRVANVQRGHLELDDIKVIDATEQEIQALRLLPGDILFNEGGDRDKLGRGWIWEGQLPECIHQNHVFRARPDISVVLPKFVSWWGNTFGRDYFLREGKQTTNLASINMTKLSALPVPVPPMAEQTRIVGEVERQLSIIGDLERTVSTRLSAARQLRNSCLQSAFHGFLGYGAGSR